MGRSRQVCIYLVFWRRQVATDACSVEAKHRGFGFVTFSSAGDAQDAIDNMDMNELQGKVLKVNIARPMKAQPQLQGNRAGAFSELPLNSLSYAQSYSMGVGGMAQRVCKTFGGERRCVSKRLSTITKSYRSR